MLYVIEIKYRRHEVGYSDVEMKLVNSKIQQLFNIVNDLEKTFEGRKFTLDGHIIGSIGEVMASYYYKLTLLPNSNEKHDAIDSDNRLIQIKTTQGKTIGISGMPDFLIVLCIDKMSGKAKEIYNGPGNLVWSECGKLQKNGQRPISVSKLQNLMKSVLDVDKVQQVNQF